MSDGSSAEEDDPELYLAAGRRMLAFSDVIIAVWDGEKEVGIGGTGQIVREAIARGLSIIWIHPDGNIYLIDDKEALDNKDGPNRYPIRLSEPLDIDNHLRVIRRIAPPDLADRARERVLRFMTERTPERSWWSAYNLIRSIILKTPAKLSVTYTVDEDTETAWGRYRAHAKTIGGERFSNALQAKLETRWRHADAVSLHCSHAYRSTYVLNFVLAGFAVLFGLMSVFWWNAYEAVEIKGAFVLIEVILILGIMTLTWLGREDRNDWHIRWLEARAFAELMRSGRTLALIGQTASPPAEKVSPVDSSEWIEWLTRSTLREVPPPTGQLNATALSGAIESALEDELAGQIDYNVSATKKYHDLDHALHHSGELLFMITLAVGASYVLFAIIYFLSSMSLDKSVTDPIKAVVTLLGAGLPAFGAALFGIKATGDFKVASEQAKRTLKKLESLRPELQKEKTAPNAAATLNLLNVLTSTLTTDLREWANIYELRELTLPG